MYKRGLSIALTAVLLFLSAADANATTISDVSKQKKQTEANLNSVNDEIEQLAEKQAQLQGELEQMDDQLVDILTSISICQDEIVAKEEEVSRAKEDLKTAQQQEEQQYEAMKQRIRFMYEKGDSAYLELFLESKSIAEALNKADYVEKVYSYDRDMLESYKEKKEDTKEKKQCLEEEEAELLSAHYELALEQQNLEQMIEQKKQTVSNFDVQLSNAKSRAQQYKKQLTEQTQQLRKLEQEKKSREDAEKKAAANKKNTAAAAQTGTSNQTDNSGQTSDAAGQTDTSQTVDSAETSDTSRTAESAVQADTDEQTESAGQEEASGADGSQTDASAQNTTNSGGSQLGTEIVNYAAQFLGNPYKFGGSSLTNGTDCSGFTMSVYSHFGISIPRDSTSQRSAGRAVSYEKAQPGDIICYAGHVALYVGNGRIIHASSETTGIIYGQATYRTILAVRRII